MTRRTIAALFALSCTLSFQHGYAHAGKTREQVQAELAEAIRLGEFPVSEDGSRPRDINPLAYPQRPQVVGKTREQVKAELAEAIRLGEYPILEDGRRPRDINPSGYPMSARHQD